jgi:hypothetical protein
VEDDVQPRVPTVTSEKGEVQDESDTAVAANTCQERLGAGLLRIAQHVAKRAGQHHDSANQVRRVYRRLRGRNDLVMTTIMVMLLSLRLNLAE